MFPEWPVSLQPVLAQPGHRPPNLGFRLCLLFQAGSPLGSCAGGGACGRHLFTFTCALWQVEGRGCDYIVLWLDCDKEGENICFEVSGVPPAGPTFHLSATRSALTLTVPQAWGCHMESFIMAQKGPSLLHLRKSWCPCWGHEAERA